MFPTSCSPAMKSVRRIAPVAILIAVIATMLMAQRPQATFPVIVVFRADADFHSFIGQFHVDNRVLANPYAWSYLDLGVAGAVQAYENSYAFRSTHVYSAALRGFAAHLNANQIAALEQDPNVEYVEADGTMQAIAQTLPWGINKIDADISSTKAGNGSGAITNVRAYIIDTGIDVTHTDLNVVNHVNFAGGPNYDCNGHGTHVSGTVAARDNTVAVVGAAPGVPLTGVKVLGCGGSGTTSGVIKGVDWVTANAVKPAVANMSLGGGASTTLDNAVKNSASKGIFYAIAAGNSGDSACKYSPARAGTANGIATVAATDSSDREPSWSNYGSCVDIWAPGVNILSTKNGGGTTTLSGTSMASPHVAGGAALYLSQHTSASPSTVESALKAAATTTANKSKDGRTLKREYVGSF
jgi:aqualysin 1